MIGFLAALGAIYMIGTVVMVAAVVWWTVRVVRKSRWDGDA